MWSILLLSQFNNQYNLETYLLAYMSQVLQTVHQKVSLNVRNGLKSMSRTWNNTLCSARSSQTLFKHFPFFSFRRRFFDWRAKFVSEVNVHVFNHPAKSGAEIFVCTKFFFTPSLYNFEKETSKVEKFTLSQLSTRWNFMKK